MPDLMDHCVPDFFHNFFRRAAESQNGPTVDRDTGWKMPADVEEGFPILGDAGVKTEEVVFRVEIQLSQNPRVRLGFDNDRDIGEESLVLLWKAINRPFNECFEFS